MRHNDDSVHRKSRNLCYQLIKLIERAPIDEDILDELPSSSNHDSDIMREELKALRSRIKSCLKQSINHGKPLDLLQHLESEEFDKFRKQVLEMLMDNTKNEQNVDERCGQEYRAKRVQVVDENVTSSSSRIADDIHPEPPRPNQIPRLDVSMLRDDIESDGIYQQELKSGDRVDSDAPSSRFEKILKICEEAEREKKMWKIEMDRRKNKVMPTILSSRPTRPQRSSIGIQCETTKMKHTTTQTIDSDDVCTSEGEVKEPLGAILTVNSRGIIRPRVEDYEADDYEEETVEDELVSARPSNCLQVRQRTISSSTMDHSPVSAID